MAALISRVVLRMASTEGSTLLTQGTNCSKGVPAIPIPGLPTSNWVNESSLILAEVVASATTLRLAFRKANQSNIDTLVLNFTTTNASETQSVASFLSQRRGETWSINISRYNVNQVP